MKTKYILIAAIFVLFLFLLTYIIVFHQGLSSNHEEWGSFGSYIGGIGGIILSCSIFYYTYLIDKEHRRTENNTKILKLLEVVGESLTCFQKWQELDEDLKNGDIYKRGQTKEQDQKKSERDRLAIKILTNYKTTQVLTEHIYGVFIEDIDDIFFARGQFNYVLNLIKYNKARSS